MSCNCADCSESITALTGPAGEDGTTTIINSATLTTTATSLPVYTVQRLDTASNSIAPAGGYDWRVLTVPAVATANLVVFDVEMAITATDSHKVTVSIKKNAVAVANITRQITITSVGGEARDSVRFKFELSNVVEGDLIDINILSSSGAVTPLFRGGHSDAKIYQ